MYPGLHAMAETQLLILYCRWSYHRNRLLENRLDKNERLSSVSRAINSKNIYICVTKTCVQRQNRFLLVPTLHTCKLNDKIGCCNNISSNS